MEVIEDWGLRNREDGGRKRDGLENDTDRFWWESTNWWDDI